jgi:CRISPR-associated endonuclease/helicase Cas3
MNDELDRKRQRVAATSGGGETPSSMESDSARRGPEHGIREGAGGDQPPSRDTRPDRATRFIETTLGILSYSELAPLLAERVLRVEARIYGRDFDDRTLDENLLSELHKLICGDLVPEWAGKWRAIEVRVGNLEPPAPHKIPILMREYGADLLARWPDASSGLSHLTLECLAFAEGRFLTIHPFTDFNGRTTRLFLLEILRRLDLPRVVLAPESEADRQIYFQALEAADRANWQPLTSIWETRLINANP